MLNLIIKDIVVQKKTIPLALLYVVFFIFFVSDKYNKGSVYIIGVTLAYIFSLGAIQYDERYKADNILISLPLTRMDIISSRYLGTIFFTAASTAFIVIFAWGLRVLNIMPNLESINMQDIKTIVITALVLMSIIIPINFKFGMKKTRVINVLMYLAFFMIILSTYENMSKNNAALMFLINNGVILSICLLAVSFICSICIYNNKDIV